MNNFEILYEMNNMVNEFEHEIEIISEELETEHDLKVLNECWHISVHPKKKSGNVFPQISIEELNTIGKIENIKLIPDGIPAFYEFNPEICYLAFEIDLKCNKTKFEIESVLNTIRGDFTIRILPPNSNISDYLELIDELSDKNMRIGEILHEIGSLTEMELEEVLNIQNDFIREAAGKDKSKYQKPLGELLVEEKIIQEPVLRAALKKQEKIRNKCN